MEKPDTESFAKEDWFKPTGAGTTPDSHHETMSTDSIPASPQIDHDLEEVARQITRASASVGNELRAFDPEPGSHLDPQSPSFNPRAWVKAYVKLSEIDEKSAPSRFLGVAFRKLSAYGWSTGAESQPTVSNMFISSFWDLARLMGRGQRGKRIDILRDFEGVVGEGELLLVLGPPGSGCSTFLKTLAGETAGFELSPDSHMNYRGIDKKHIVGSLRGEVLYNAEVDSHLAHLTVGETLSFAAGCRSVRHVPGGFSRDQADKMMRDVMMAVFGISHTVNTRVGDDFVRGVSGGERKRVSIAEAALTGAKFQCWDNSTRGLDSANAINFCQNLRLQADLLGVGAAVAVYQAPQSAYEQFDLVTVLYEGRQIFFGKITEAKAYFEDLGFECPDRQTTPDFLTSMTSAVERRAKPGFEGMVPRTPDEFAARWKASSRRQELVQSLDEYDAKHPSNQRLGEYNESRRAEQSKHQRAKSPYVISYLQQVRLTIWRAWRRLLADPGFTIASLLFNLIIALVLGSIFYNLPPDTSSFYYRGGVVFFTLLFNAFASQLEVLTVYAERPVVEKQNKYAFYHQSTQAIASYIMDIPYKTVNMIVFNVLIYFMANLRREAGPFFFFCFVSYLSTLVMSTLYRLLASVTRTSHEAMVQTAFLSLALMMYAGFTIPTYQMRGWSRWMNYLNPLAYAFEALMANEFHGRVFNCDQIVPQGPGYTNLPSDARACASVGALPGATTVDGERYIKLAFEYYNTHKWRNVGILFGMLTFFFGIYILASEFAKSPDSKGEVLVFPSGKIPSGLSESGATDVELQPHPRDVVAESGASSHTGVLPGAGTKVFHWENLCYDISIKGAERRILTEVDGWVKPGTSTALMGVSGAGKTTLLDVLATRVTMGVVTGDTLINGAPTDSSFQHRVGYVQQQDLHLETMTVREALEFSALLRQSAEIPKQEKLDYVDYVIDLLDMHNFVDAVVGVPGEGLNVEQRKRLTIGVELAGRPKLLLFLDEPTSGLDSQTSWSICQLIKKLTRSGQAVLCTIHQPSAMLFSQFDRLLLLAPGGKTVYFGELGESSNTLIDYFEKNGAPKCPSDGNPAEWMLQIIKPKTDGSTGINWHQVWRDSSEFKDTKQELSRLRALASTDSTLASETSETETSQHREFVASTWEQMDLVFTRTWKHFWRSPSYIWSKTVMITISALYIGFSFKSVNSLQGAQNQLYAIFMILVLFNALNEQIMPMFIPQRALYEIRERPSKIYNWQVFLLSNIAVEAIWNTLMSVLLFFCWYYPVGFVKNTTSDDEHVRGFLMFLFIWMFLLFTSTFSNFAVAWMPSSEVAGVLASLIWMLCIALCGVAVARVDLPGFWIFMYRISPATYLIGGVMAVAMGKSDMKCAQKELVILNPPGNMTCSEFLGPYAKAAAGNLLNPEATEACNYCSLATTDQFLARFSIEYSERWRNFGLLWVYILANVVGALALYWVFRVPKGKGTKRA